MSTRVYGRVTTPRPYRISPKLIFWVVGGLVANASSLIDSELAFLLLGAVGLFHSAVTFLRDGGDRITAPGIFLLASGLFAFFPAVYIYYDSNPFPHGEANFALAVNIVFWSQLAMYYLFWEPRTALAASVSPTESSRIRVCGMVLGWAMIVAGVLLTGTFLSAYGFDDGLAFSGVVLLAVAAFRQKARLGFITYMLVILAFVVYVEFVFVGFGRLQVGSLGIAIAVALAHRWPKRLVKASLLVAFPPVLVYLAASRVAFTGTLNPNQSASVTGLESVVGPFFRFAELLHIDRTVGLPYTWGQSFSASFTAMIPRVWWPEKPVGFGAELGLLFRPELAGSGHSELALIYGEFLFAFGLVGIVLSAGIVGIMLRLLDRAHHQSSQEDTLAWGGVLRVVILVILSASLVDLFWGGTFTYMSRVGPRLLSLLPIVAVMMLTSVNSKKHISSAGRVVR